MSTRPSRPALPREVRIIGGQWKRTRLPVLDKPGLRPTLDRVRETLFNWLGQDLTGWRCLDAFAGTGALGFEAASRGATEVVLLEHDPHLVRQLKTLQSRLGASMMRIECVDAQAWMKRAAAAEFDLVLLDPPFTAGLGLLLLPAAARLAKPGGWVYLETGEAVAADAFEAAGLRPHRQGRAGSVHFHLLARMQDPIH